LNNWHLRQAVRHLAVGGIIAYPTEAIFGLGCDPNNALAVASLLALKQRPWQKGLILIAANYAQLAPFLKPLTLSIQERVFATWPGAVTWLLPSKPEVPHWLTGKSNKLAVRVTAHPQTIALCQHWNGALVSTSANISNRPAAKTALKVQQIFSHNLDYIVHGSTGGRRCPSEIRDALTNRVLRV